MERCLPYIITACFAVFMATALLPFFVAAEAGHTFMDPLPEWVNGGWESWAQNRSFPISWGGDYNGSVKCYGIIWTAANMSSQPPNISSWQPLKYNGSDCFPSGARQAFIGNGSPEIREGLRYYFAVRAENALNQTEPWPQNISGSGRVASAVIDTIPPSIGVVTKDQNGNIIFPGKIPVSATKVSIYATANDTTSGVEKAELLVFLFPGGYRAEQAACRKDTDTSAACTHEFEVSRNVQVGFRLEAGDKAGNKISFPAEPGRWAFLASHPVANFVEESIWFTLGSSSEAEMAVRNTENATDNVTVTLSGYRLAGFLPVTGGGSLIENNGRVLRVYSLMPGEQRVFGVRIFSGEPGAYLLNATAEGALGGMDSTGMQVQILLPASFSATGWAAAIFMVAISAAVFFLLSRKNRGVNFVFI